MDMNIIDTLEKQREELTKLSEENREKLRLHFDRLFSTDDGKFFYNVLALYTGLYRPDGAVGNEILRENNGKRKVITELILPNLSKEVRRKLYE